jgi:hypothetical protein
MKKMAQLVKGQRTDPVESELAELGEECARVLLLLQRLAKARAEGHDVSDLLGELSATVLHLHAHTKGLDELIDDLASD